MPMPAPRIEPVAAVPPCPTDLGWLEALRRPAVCTAWDLAAWERVIRRARRMRLLGRLGQALAAAGLLHQIPPEAANHLRAEARLAAWRCDSLRWALAQTGQALAGAPYPVVLLKGAAYIAQDLPIAQGRMPSDVDLMVPRHAVADAQARLAAHGWAEVELDDHDQRYYREWSHELPPLRHAHHELELDLHHNILPPVARTRVDAALLLARVQPVPGTPWHVLHPMDQLLHSAAHLFHDADHGSRVRDLVDMDHLLRSGGSQPGYGPALARRAAELGLEQPLALALAFCAGWLGTPLPQGAGLPGLDGPDRVLWARCLARVLEPASMDDEPDLAERWSGLLLLWRHHLWRMPLPMLLGHTWHKLRRGDVAPG
jgi:hypothetical protein